MAKTKNSRSSTQSRMDSMKKKYLTKDYLIKLIFDPRHIALTCWLLLVAEILLNIYIIESVKYTEIDWIAYMQEVSGFLNGTLDYEYLKGDTGPCVYPAGFLYLYSILYFVTSNGTNIRLAQYIFLGLYMAQLYLTYEIYKKTCKIPAYAIILSAITSYRIHSIYVLRLFNDPFAVFFFYFSLYSLIQNKWKLGSLLFSIAVSIKMNILLYAPCLLMAYLTNLTYKETFVNLAICGLIQIILGAPFLYTNFFAYLKASFDLSRVFEHQWTVNYRFLQRDIFENKIFHLSLLLLHIVLLLAFEAPMRRYLRSYATLRRSIAEMKSSMPCRVEQKPEEEELTNEQKSFLDSFEKQISRGTSQRRANRVHKKVVQEEEQEKEVINFSRITQLLVLPFFVTNLIGIACARSLHYQFYSWYYHSLLYLAHCLPYRKSVCFLLLGVIEFCWNTYPSTDFSSSLLHICHISILYGLYKTMKS